MDTLLSRTDVRMGLAALTVVCVVGTGAFVAGGSEANSFLGPDLSIALVAPVEPVVAPGETMDVGELNDGFDRAVLERLPEPAFDDPLPEPVPRMPMPTPVSDTRVIDVPLSAGGTTGDPLADGSRAFGFDTPRPDYAAERRLRWSRLDAAPAQSATGATTNAEGGPVQYSSE